MNKENKAIEKLTSRVKIYLIIIALLFILICLYDKVWIIPSLILYWLLLVYTIWFNTKKKTEIETHIEEVAWGMNSTVRNVLNKSPIPLLVIETDGDIIYKSPKFINEFKEIDVMTYVESLIKEIKLEIENNTEKKEINKQITIDKKVYKVLCEYGISKKRDKVAVTDQLKDTLLQPGESAVVEVILTWINSEDNLDLKTNIAEISEDKKNIL